MSSSADLVVASAPDVSAQAFRCGDVGPTSSPSGSPTLSIISTTAPIPTPIAQHATNATTPTPTAADTTAPAVGSAPIAQATTAPTPKPTAEDTVAHTAPTADPTGGPISVTTAPVSLDYAVDDSASTNGASLTCAVGGLTRVAAVGCVLALWACARS